MEINEVISGIVWSDGMLLLILGVGLYLSVRTGFFHIFRMGTVFRETAGKLFSDRGTRRSSDKKAISQLQSLSTALAATMGTGNIVGVATALTLGGAGAVFWMWVSALFGMMTVFAENVLGILYRYRGEKGEWIGGPMVYLEKGLRCRGLGVVYGAVCTLASFGIGNMTQANSIAAAAEASFGIPPAACGIVIAVLTGVILFGGLKRIGAVTEKIIPVLSIAYIIGAILIIVINFRNIPAVFGEIFRGAFGADAVVGGVSGSLIKQALSVGVRKGIFSNEAGLGSTVLVHASSDIDSPVRQGFWGIFEVFTDTMVCCTLTAVAVLSTGALSGGADGAALVIEAFSSGFGVYSGGFITACIALFAFATLLGWSCFGAKTAEYLFGEKGAKVYRVLFVLAIIPGAVTEMKTVWGISDTLNGLMAVPNLIGVILLSPVVIKEYKKWRESV